MRPSRLRKLSGVLFGIALVTTLVGLVSAWISPYITFSGIDVRVQRGILYLSAANDIREATKLTPDLLVLMLDPNKTPWRWQDGIGFEPLTGNHVFDGNNNACLTPRLQFITRHFHYSKGSRGGHRVLIPLWEPILLVLVIAILVRYTGRPQDGHCSICGYNLFGVANTCPECGAKTNRSPPKHLGTNKT